MIYGSFFEGVSFTLNEGGQTVLQAKMMQISSSPFVRTVNEH
jgi:hypothetical protein